ncbi:MAG: 16S rRNA (guanine(527)-N(7))-methyltransferase RsmG [Holosporaceae bacterium]|jgi:16S rRNA (guanine527-N7)-methyltransferase|nr:16S rRNA (guanine(527)-N(7))-methyltransferase RsmG [Holosporaceae bacterium]
MLRVVPNVPRETIKKLEMYAELLIKWQNSINLVSRDTLGDVWNRHFLDSLQLLTYIGGNSILDVGSGGGFPGMVLAIAGNLPVTCIDADKRKILFLEEVARITDTNVTLIADRIENLKNVSYGTVCARGFSNMRELVAITERLAPLGRGVFLKGKTWRQELEQARHFFDFHHEEYCSNPNKEGKIIIVYSIKRCG